MKQGFVIPLIFLLNACAIGNGRICGPQTPRAYCDKEMYQELMHPPPYLQYWEKEGDTMTLIERRQDSVSCGAIDLGNSRDPDGYPGFTQQELEAARHPGEELIIAEKRLRADWQRCMIKKGYYPTEHWLLLIDKYPG